MTFSDFMARLDALGLFHMDLTLERMRGFVERAGMPGFAVLHVVGTNGKGSTATMLAELLRAHGLKTGLYTSPHLVDVRERILVDGRRLSEEAWARYGAEALEISEGLGLTYFELLTAVALLAFRGEGVQAAVMEAGLGGRYDATNVVNPQLTVFTPIAMDHMNVLGATLAEIAADKADAMRPGGLAVSAAQEPEVFAVLEARARELSCELIDGPDVLYYSRANGRLEPGPLGRGWVRPLRDLRLGMEGVHQEGNARLALAAFHVWARRLRLPVSEAACREALKRSFVPGRMQRVAASEQLPELILDGGHNPHGLAALADSLQSGGVQPSVVVFGCLGDKPLDEMLPLVRRMGQGARLIACGIPSCPRALAPEALAGLLDTPEHAPDVHAALEMLAGVPGSVLICGSLYLLGEFYTKHDWLLERPA